MRPRAEPKRADLLNRAPWLDRPEVHVVVDDMEGSRFEPDPDVSYWFERVNVANVDFSRGRFGWYRHGEFGGSFWAAGSEFVDCDFTKVRFDNGAFGQWQQSFYRRCPFDGAEIWSRQRRSSISLGNARFERCSFDGAKVRMWRADQAEFIGCSFATLVDRCQFYGRPAAEPTPPRRRNEFRDNDFSGGELLDTVFRSGIDIDAQRWPSEGYVRLDNPRSRIEHARAHLADVPIDFRRVIEIELQLLEFEATSQDVLLWRRDVPGSNLPREGAELLWRLLGVSGA